MISCGYFILKATPHERQTVLLPKEITIVNMAHDHPLSLEKRFFINYFWNGEEEKEPKTFILFPNPSYTSSIINLDKEGIEYKNLKFICKEDMEDPFLFLFEVVD